MVDQMERNHVRKAPAHVWGDSAVVAGGYNYPHWDPARFDRRSTASSQRSRSAA
jgi:hypothetical protein